MPFGHQGKEAGRLGLASDPGPCGEGAGRRAGATGHSARTQARNPARVEAGARVRRSSHKIRPPRMASGVAVSSASAAFRCWWWARTTAMRVSLARA